MKKRITNAVLETLVGDLASLARREVPLTAQELIENPELIKSIASLDQMKQAVKGKTKQKTLRLAVSTACYELNKNTLNRHNLRIVSAKMGGIWMKRIIPTNGLMENPQIQSILSRDDLAQLHSWYKEQQDAAEKQIHPRIEMHNKLTPLTTRAAELLGLPVTVGRKLVLTIRESYSKLVEKPQLPSKH